MHNLRRKLSDTLSALAEKANFEPEIGLILGSGLGVVADEIQDSVSIPYSELPYFPISTVAGHPGRLVLGNLSGKKVVAMQGRFHSYEGYALREVTYPVRLMQRAGIKKLIITNAAGGIGDHLRAGDLMVIEDHINLMGDNPLIGANDAELGPRFPDMTEAYDVEMAQVSLEVAKEQGQDLKQGIYAALKGPSYETPAEIRFLKTIGADAVGMSTVPEVIVARHAGLRVLGISCIANMAAGISAGRLNHEEVMATAQRATERFSKLLKGILLRLEV